MSDSALQIHIGTYEGEMLGFHGDLQNIENYYNIQGYYFNVRSSNSLRSMITCGRYLFVAGFDEIIRIYDIKTKREAGQLEKHDSSIVTMKAFENYLMSAGQDGKVNIWKIKDWSLLHTLDTQIEVKDIEIHSTGKLLFVIGKAGKLSCWDLTRCQKLHHQKLNKSAEMLLLNQQETGLFLLNDNSVSLLDLDTNLETILFKSEERLQLMVKHNEYLIMGTEFGKVLIYNNIEKKLECELDNKSNRIKGFKIINVGFDLLVVVSSDGSIKLWDTFQRILNKNLLSNYEPIYQIQTKQRINCMTAVDHSWTEEKIEPVELKLKVIKREAEKTHKEKRMDKKKQKKEQKLLKKQQEAQEKQRLKRVAKYGDRKDYKKKEWSSKEEKKKHFMKNDLKKKDQNKGKILDKSKKIKKSTDQSKVSTKKTVKKSSSTSSASKKIIKKVKK